MGRASDTRADADTPLCTDMPRPRPVTELREMTQSGSYWWRWWPLLALAASVGAWLTFGVDIAHGAVVAGVAVYALADALGRGRSSPRALALAVAWAAGAWVAGLGLGALTGWGPVDRGVQGLWGLAAGVIVALGVLAVRTARRPRGREARTERAPGLP